MYNEAAVARLVLDDVLLTCSRAGFGNLVDVVVIDDGSNDGTEFVLDQEPHITVIRHGQRTGVGAALASALEYCKRVGASHLAWHVGNGRISASSTATLINLSLTSGADYILGSRFVSGGSAINTPPLRLLAMRIGNSLIRGLTGNSPTDMTCGARVLRLAAWDHQLNDAIRGSRYLGEQMMTMAMIRAGRSVKEAGVVVRYSRLRTHSYFSWSEVARVGRAWLWYSIVH